MTRTSVWHLTEPERTSIAARARSEWASMSPSARTADVETFAAAAVLEAEADAQAYSPENRERARARARGEHPLTASAETVQFRGKTLRVTEQRTRPDSLAPFSAVAYSGAAVPMGFGGKMILDLEGFSRRVHVPILRQHDHGAVIGRIDSASVTSRGLEVRGLIDRETSAGAEVVALAKRGHTWAVSIGFLIESARSIEAGSAERINGHNVQGPAVIAERFAVVEVSLVAVGRDERAWAEIK